MKVFFPEVGRPSREDVQRALDGIYPGCKLQRYDATDYQPGQPMLDAGMKEEVEWLESQLNGKQMELFDNH